jgi:lysophospholipase L1-like esterase
VLLTWILLGCSEPDRGSIENSKILAVGDSIFEWGLGEYSAPEVVGRVLNLPVHNAAISGSMISTNEDWSIPNQYIDGDWDWVILDGGANDLNELCLCDQCSEVNNKIDTALANLVSSIRTQDIGVVIWGYYGIPSSADEFGNCIDTMAELSTRQESFAADDPKVLWVDGRIEITGENHDHFDTDLIHPSLLGAQIIGEQIAAAIQAFEE